MHALSPAHVVHAQLVNVQSNAEFASHLLNRDTWRDDMVRSVIAGSFIFWQVTAPPFASLQRENGSTLFVINRRWETPACCVFQGRPTRHGNPSQHASRGHALLGAVADVG
jgi:hypothetical protein